MPSAAERVSLGSGTPGGTAVHYFGDYELLAEIGRGGMGVVYRARQKSLNRLVALKLILSGRFASREDVERFQREAQAAANLQHDNIVRVHEVGEYEGQHYYSMDLIEGQSLAELVRQHPLPALQSAGYLKTVCDAIHYAHEHRTLHRDLKPTNILIDGRDQPRITDFGLARCEHSDPHLTASGQILGTPAFMPPEQADAKRSTVGPGNDVYSIGAVFYYLLTQRPPFAAESLPAVLDQVIHNEPVSPRALNPSVPRDAETICLKCLQKDPAHRFSSAQELSDELRRFCCGQPILSRPSNCAERAWRWCDRNRAVSASLAAFIVVLLAGTAVSSWEAFRAKAEAAKSQQIARFLQQMLHSVRPSVALGRDTTMLREILDETAARVAKELKSQPEVRADLQSIIGGVYNDLELYPKAETVYRDAFATFSHIRRSGDAGRASILLGLSLALENQGQFAEAEHLAKEALAVSRKLFGNDHPDVADALECLAMVRGLQGNLEEAETMLRQVVGIQRRVLGNEHPDLATSFQNLGQTLRVAGKYAQAEAMEREALAMRQKLFGDEHPDIAASLNGLATALEAEERFGEAESIFRQALALRRKLLGSQHPRVAESLNNLAILLHNRDNLTEAESLHREALTIERKVLGNRHRDVANTLHNLALVLRDEGDARKLVEADRVEREALALWKSIFGPEHYQVATSLNSLAAITSDQGKFQEAESLQRQALAMQRKLLPAQHSDIAISLNNLAAVVRAQSRFAEAEALQREALALLRQTARPEQPLIAAFLNNLGGDYCEQGKQPEAESAFREALAMQRKSLGNEHSDVARSLHNLGDLLREQGKLDEAERTLREAVAVRRKTLGDKHADLATSLERLADTFLALGRLEDADRELRECLAIRELNAPGDRSTASARGGLGIILLERKKYAEAERLLLSGYAGLEEKEARLPAASRRELLGVVNALIRLYDETTQTENAARWRKKLKEFNEPRGYGSATPGPKPK